MPKSYDTVIFVKQNRHEMWTCMLVVRERCVGEPSGWRQHVSHELSWDTLNVLLVQRETRCHQPGASKEPFPYLGYRGIAMLCLIWLASDLTWLVCHQADIDAWEWTNICATYTSCHKLSKRWTWAKLKDLICWHHQRSLPTDKGSIVPSCAYLRLCHGP